ncbi:MAG: GNAT family N-acetyltransferase [Candidatus Bathyarchaeia archaeon]
MISIRKTNEEDISGLSAKFSKFLEDKKSKIYKDNVAKFGIPDKYVKKALAEETLLKAMSSGKSTFYIAVENSEMAGFAQIIHKDHQNVELDRIVVFPPYERKGIGTRMLHQAIDDEKKKGTSTMTVNAGKNELHARKFYEKRGFKLIKETTIDAPWGKKLDLAIYRLGLKPS